MVPKVKDMRVRMTTWKSQMKKTRIGKLTTVMTVMILFALGGLELTQEEESDLDGLLPLNNGFIGLAFVHRLMRTHVLLGSMNYKGMIVERQVIHEAGNLKRAQEIFFFKKSSYMWCKCTWRWLECQIHRRLLLLHILDTKVRLPWKHKIMLMSVSGMVTQLKHMYLQSKGIFVFAYFILLGLGSPNYVELEHDCLEISMPKYSPAATRNAEDNDAAGANVRGP
ncbi:uncharacterized protein LOC119275017 [Triticum dicoccoides]|uniref:uncharacterized protein LOC119275017 n=1 Tax=Triticum dicoccoides TaxID=85692 RepID=UPI000E7B1E97|nr:uncharacterized protein LOC119275017 [Triticum dicoccoides]